MIFLLHCNGKICLQCRVFIQENINLVKMLAISDMVPQFKGNCSHKVKMTKGSRVESLTVFH